MLPPVGPDAVILLDACSLINLYATRRIVEILNSVSMQCVVSDIVLRESLYVRRGSTGEEADERDPIELRPLSRFWSA